MTSVLIVEDEFIIACSVEQALMDAGYDVCGVASSQGEALDLANTLRPDYAVVDITLHPGDGRVVAKVLSEHGAAVLFATGQCEEVAAMTDTGAIACLPKPYSPADIPLALKAMSRLVRGYSNTVLPSHMFALRRAVV